MKLPLKLSAVPRRYLLGSAGLIVCALASAAIYQATRPAAAPSSMAAMLPQGALLTIESPDFAALLHQWNASPEQKAWLASDNYAVFSRSHLFGRLDDARAEFEAAAKSSPNSNPSLDGDFLTQVAGHQSIFAWYDVSNLEFLYITRIDSSQTANIALLRERAAWSPRQSGGVTFYIRKTGEGSGPGGKGRSVAFAQIPDPAGNLLILATREDLIANALELIHPAANAPPNAARADSVATEAWFTEASAALPRIDHPPVLHMVLNLDRMVGQPYFRTYWVQDNLTAMAQYRSAVSDLYPYPGQFHEERVLLPKSADDAGEQAYLGTLTGIVPATGVYRAVATANPDDAVTALEEKLLGRITLAKVSETNAPDPSLEAPQSGSSSASSGDLEVRIDAPAPVTPAVSNRALADTLKAAGLDAMLTWSSAQSPSTPAGLWVPIHSAVALEASTPWSPQTLQSALQQSLRGSLTTSNLGIEFTAETVPNQAPAQTIYALTGPKPLFFATLTINSPSTSPTPVNLCLLADDRPLLLSLLTRAHELTQTEARGGPGLSTLIAGFDHTSQRAPFARLTTLVDGTNQPRREPVAEIPPAQGSGPFPPPPPLPPPPPGQPAFFSGDMRSLSDSFATLASEHFVERREGPILRQTVLYQWQTP